MSLHSHKWIPLSLIGKWFFFSLFTPCAYIIPTYLTERKVEFIWQHILFICIICPSDLYCSLMEKQPQQMFIVTVTSPPLRCFFSELHKLPVGNNTDINKLLHWSQTEVKLKSNWSQTVAVFIWNSFVLTIRCIMKRFILKCWSIISE